MHIRKVIKNYLLDAEYFFLGGAVRVIMYRMGVVYRRLKTTKVTPLPPRLLEEFPLAARNTFLCSVAHYLRSQKRTGFEYWEFGSYGGHTFRMALNCFGSDPKNSLVSHFVAFDSFQGMPEPAGIDKAKIWFKGACLQDIDVFKRLIKRDLWRTDIVPGFFEDSLKLYRVSNERIPAIVYIDCDYYSSTKVVLEFLSDKLTHGAIVAFDDWDLYYGDPERGMRKAFAEFKNENPHYSFEPWLRIASGGTSFICHEKNKIGTEVE
jgi:O-methyltransferase